MFNCFAVYGDADGDGDGDGDGENIYCQSKYLSNYSFIWTSYYIAEYLLYFIPIICSYKTIKTNSLTM